MSILSDKLQIEASTYGSPVSRGTQASFLLRCSVPFHSF